MVDFYPHYASDVPEPGTRRRQAAARCAHAIERQEALAVRFYPHQHQTLLWTQILSALWLIPPAQKVRFLSGKVPYIFSKTSNFIRTGITHLALFSGVLSTATSAALAITAATTISTTYSVAITPEVAATTSAFTTDATTKFAVTTTMESTTLSPVPTTLATTTTSVPHQLLAWTKPSSSTGCTGSAETGVCASPLLSAAGVAAPEGLNDGARRIERRVNFIERLRRDGKVSSLSAQSTAAGA
ncbi:hypothetical protein BDZ89DRAFT_1114118 [Hymenopellis radicata]|nr:hypothetical protein BDZ89DRAFT_1114118 [Hymenopellis radicata]